MARYSGTAVRRDRGPGPVHAEALAALSHGRAAECARLCEAMLAKRPRDGTALHLLGVARLRLGDGRGAVETLGRAARLAPHNAEILANLGAALRAAGDAAGAAKTLRRAVALQPAAASAHYNLGNALAELGRHEEAVAAYRRAIALDPAHAAAHNNLGLALKAMGLDDEAVAAWRRSAAARPRQRDAHVNLGRALLAAGKAADALCHFDLALQAAPDDPEIHNDRGVALLELERADEAVAALRTAVALKPNRCDAWVNLGSALCLAGHADRGAAEFNAALAASPEDADTLSNLGAALNTAGSREAALKALERALALAPCHADALNNMGEALRNAGRIEEAVACYDRALAADADHATARFGRATANLLLGRFRAGWEDYLARPSMVQGGRYHRTPLPESLAGVQVLVEGDQGLGDEIFFLRFLAALEARGARVRYRPDPRLAAMLERARIPVVADAEAGRPAFRLAVGDLPYLLGHNEAAPLPPSIALSPAPERTARLEARLAAFGPPPYLGLTWRAGTRGRRRALFKEAPPAAFAALRGLHGTWIALQRAPDAGEIAAVEQAIGAPLLDLTALNADLEDMLALAALLDDYICVSNTNVHLRAAAGRTCRVLVPHPPEFRWMAAGEESPWFPGTRVYRQTADGDWSAAFAALARDLAAAFPGD